MQTQTTRWLLLAILMALIFFAGLFFGQNETLSPESTDLKGRKSASEPAGEIGQPDQTDRQEDDQQDMVLSSDGKSSYRVKSGKRRPDTVSPSINRSPRLDIDWESEYESREVLDSALDGNEDDVIAVSELVAQCRGISADLRSIESQLKSVSRNLEAGNPLPTLLIPGTGESLKFTDFHHYEEFALTRFAECQATRGMFDSALRQRLEELAKSGSVTARFLYAMWLPEQREVNESNLLEWITYQGLAWDFTWANIREGEPLGLLAYGRSLEQSSSIYFTPRHFNYGPAFILASQKCGLVNKIVDQKISTLTSYWSERNMTQRLDQADSLSDQIADMFCR